MTRYANGATFERTVKKDMQALGWFVVRAAGSHGPVDLMCQAPGPTMAWVQCKRDGRMSTEDKNALRLLALAFDAIPILAFRDVGGEIRYYEIFADKLMDWFPGGIA